MFGWAKKLTARFPIRDSEKDPLTADDSDPDRNASSPEATPVTEKDAKGLWKANSNENDACGTAPKNENGMNSTTERKTPSLARKLMRFRSRSRETKNECRAKSKSPEPRRVSEDATLRGRQNGSRRNFGFLSPPGQDHTFTTSTKWDYLKPNTELVREWSSSVESFSTTDQQDISDGHSTPDRFYTPKSSNSELSDVGKQSISDMVHGEIMKGFENSQHSKPKVSCTVQNGSGTLDSKSIQSKRKRSFQGSDNNVNGMLNHQNNGLIARNGQGSTKDISVYDNIHFHSNPEAGKDAQKCVQEQSGLKLDLHQRKSSLEKPIATMEKKSSDQQKNVDKLFDNLLSTCSWGLEPNKQKISSSKPSGQSDGASMTRMSQKNGSSLLSGSQYTTTTPNTTETGRNAPENISVIKAGSQNNVVDTKELPVDSQQSEQRKLQLNSSYCTPSSSINITQKPLSTSVSGKDVHHRPFPELKTSQEKSLQKNILEKNQIQSLISDVDRYQRMLGKETSHLKALSTSAESNGTFLPTNSLVLSTNIPQNATLSYSMQDKDKVYSPNTTAIGKNVVDLTDIPANDQTKNSINSSHHSETNSSLSPLQELDTSLKISDAETQSSQYPGIRLKKSSQSSAATLSNPLDVIIQSPPIVFTDPPKATIQPPLPLNKPQEVVVQHPPLLLRDLPSDTRRPQPMDVPNKPEESLIHPQSSSTFDNSSGSVDEASSNCREHPILSHNSPKTVESSSLATSDSSKVTQESGKLPSSSLQFDIDGALITSTDTTLTNSAQQLIMFDREANSSEELEKTSTKKEGMDSATFKQNDSNSSQVESMSLPKKKSDALGKEEIKEAAALTSKFITQLIDETLDPLHDEITALENLQESKLPISNWGNTHGQIAIPEDATAIGKDFSQSEFDISLETDIINPATDSKLEITALCFTDLPKNNEHGDLSTSDVSGNLIKLEDVDSSLKSDPELLTKNDLAEISAADSQKVSNNNVYITHPNESSTNYIHDNGPDEIDRNLDSERTDYRNTAQNETDNEIEDSKLKDIDESQTDILNISQQTKLQNDTTEVVEEKVSNESTSQPRNSADYSMNSVDYSVNEGDSDEKIKVPHHLLHRCPDESPKKVESPSNSSVKETEIQFAKDSEAKDTNPVPITISTELIIASVDILDDTTREEPPVTSMDEGLTKVQDTRREELPVTSLDESLSTVQYTTMKEPLVTSLGEGPMIVQDTTSEELPITSLDEGITTVQDTTMEGPQVTSLEGPTTIENTTSEEPLVTSLEGHTAAELRIQERGSQKANELEEIASQKECQIAKQSGTGTHSTDGQATERENNENQNECLPEESNIKTYENNGQIKSDIDEMNSKNENQTEEKLKTLAFHNELKATEDKKIINSENRRQIEESNINQTTKEDNEIIPEYEGQINDNVEIIISQDMNQTTENSGTPTTPNEPHIVRNGIEIISLTEDQTTLKANATILQDDIQTRQEINVIPLPIKTRKVNSSGGGDAVPPSPVAPRRKKKRNVTPTILSDGAPDHESSPGKANTNSLTRNTPPRPPPPSPSLPLISSTGSPSTPPGTPQQRRSFSQDVNNIQTSDQLGIETPVKESLNPFDSEDDEVVEPKPKLPPKKTSLNPFDSEDDDDDDGDKDNVLNASRKAACSEQSASNQKHLSPPAGYNPFDDDDDDDDDDDENNTQDEVVRAKENKREEYNGRSNNIHEHKPPPPIGYNPFDEDDDDEVKSLVGSQSVNEKDDSKTNDKSRGNTQGPATNNPFDEDEDEKVNPVSNEFIGPPAVRGRSHSPFQGDGSRTSPFHQGRVLISKKKRQAPLPPGYRPPREGSNPPATPTLPRRYRLGESPAFLENNALNRGMSSSTLSLWSRMRTPPPRPPPPRRKSTTVVPVVPR